MQRRSEETPLQTANENTVRRNAKPNVFKSLNWKKELDRVLKNRAVRIPAAKTRQEIRCRFGNEAECEMLTPETIALKCPISNKRIQVAVKGVNCLHMQCFDLSTFIQIRVCSNRWYCPLCESETKLDQLRIIEFVNAILHTTDTSVERVELLGDGSFRPVAQAETCPDVKINDDLPYVTAPEDVKPDVAEGCLALSEAMDVGREPPTGSAMAASFEPGDASALEDVKPIVALQPAQSGNVGPEVIIWHINERAKGIASDEAENSILEDVKPVIARGAINSTLGASEDVVSQRTDIDEDDNLKVLLKASNAEVQRISQELCTERAARLDLEQKVSQLRKDLDEAKALFDGRQQKRVQEDRENAAHAENAYPVTWQGEIQMKAASAFVQMHRVSGSTRWIDATNRELVNELDGLKCVKITQRMRLEPLHIENLVRQMEKEDNFIALVCLPCGRSWEEIHMQTKRMSSSFVEYFKSKTVAGIVNSGSRCVAPSCVMHVFPPCNFAVRHLQVHAPDLLVLLQKHSAGYLFIVITPTSTVLISLPVHTSQRPFRLPFV